MKKILILVAIAILIIACAPNNNTNNGKGKAVPVNTSKVDGKKIFKIYCVACHGLDGKLAVNGAKDFTESTMTLEERIIIVNKGRNMMTPFKGMLNEEEIKAVAEYTMKLTKGKQ